MFHHSPIQSCHHPPTNFVSNRVPIYASHHNSFVYTAHQQSSTNPSYHPSSIPSSIHPTIHQVRTLAKEIHRCHFKTIESVPRGSLALLSDLCSQLHSNCQAQIHNVCVCACVRACVRACVCMRVCVYVSACLSIVSNSFIFKFPNQFHFLFFNTTATIQYIVTTTQAPWKGEMKAQLGRLVSLLKDEHTLSTYELHTSGIVATLLRLFKVSSGGGVVVVWCGRCVGCVAVVLCLCAGGGVVVVCYCVVVVVLWLCVIVWWWWYCDCVVWVLWLCGGGVMVVWRWCYVFYVVLCSDVAVCWW